jgi:hypothetical protein
MFCVPINGRIWKQREKVERLRMKVGGDEKKSMKKMEEIHAKSRYYLNENAAISFFVCSILY